MGVFIDTKFKWSNNKTNRTQKGRNTSSWKWFIRHLYTNWQSH